MELRTHDRVYNLKLSLGETLVVEFCPMGANEPCLGGPLIGFAVSTMHMPGGKMAISIKMPDGRTFEGTGKWRGGPLVRYLIDNPGNADEMTFVLHEECPRRELEVKRVRKGHSGCHGRRHGGVHEWGSDDW